MPNIAQINGIAEDNISHHNGGTAALYTSKNGDTWVHETFNTATGGAITTSGGYKIHTFVSSGTFAVSELGNTDANKKVEFLVVAGGGGGGLRNSTASETSGGGGSSETDITASASSYTVTVGAGGASFANGANSVFGSITSIGGGKGDNASHPHSSVVGSGGSGGGGAWSYGTGGAGTSNQGWTTM